MTSPHKPDEALIVAGVALVGNLPKALFNIFSMCGQGYHDERIAKLSHVGQGSLAPYRSKIYKVLGISHLPRGEMFKTMVAIYRRFVEIQRANPTAEVRQPEVDVALETELYEAAIKIAARRVPKLIPSRFRVLCVIGMGNGYREAAAELGLSHSSVESITSEIVGILGLTPLKKGTKLPTLAKVWESYVKEHGTD
jgi:DNA-binding NarL/FixJ family response regulator